MDKNKALAKRRLRRRFHVRKKLRGSAEHPRLSVSRTLKHFSCQLIDDDAGKTIASASTKDAALRGNVSGNAGNSAAAAVIGKAIAEKALAAGVKTVKMDRGSNKYHGRVKAFADAAREGGLQF
ncbi:MAG: 50S ribosomal protein L18 [Planctomycetota bacterium]